VAQCIARLALNAGPTQTSSIVKGLLGQLQVLPTAFPSPLSRICKSIPIRVWIESSSAKDCHHGCWCDALRRSVVLRLQTRCWRCAEWQWRVGVAGRDQGPQALCHRGGITRCSTNYGRKATCTMVLSIWRAAP